MSIDDSPSLAETCSLIQSHVQKYVQSRQKSGSNPAVTENESANLVQHLLDLKSRSDSHQLALARLDSIFRDRFTNIVETTNISDPDFLEIWVMVDLITILSDAECCEKGLNFLLIEELLDSRTIDGCRKVFDFLEPRRERMIAKYWPEKKLVILRCGNELLRRLSRAEDTVFCGRVFIYMFQCFPLGDKSSVNLRGEYHTDNVTVFDPSPEKSDNAIKPMEVDTDGPNQIPSGAQTPASTAPDSDVISKTGRSTPLPRPTKSEPKPTEAPPDLDVLYPKFWSLQTIFSSPTRLFDSSTMTQFKEGLNLTLTTFKTITTTSTASAPSTGSKRKHSQVNATSSTSTPFNPKYLTNRDLFDLEIHDLAFRRHILVQSLIMLDFLLSLSPTSKSKYSDLLNWRPPPPLTESERERETEEDKARKVAPNKSVLYPYTLSSDDEKWCTDTRRQITTYLQNQGVGNDGKLYQRMVENVLSRDKNWMRWKAESCPLISRAPVPVSTYLEAQKRLVGITEQANRPLTTPMGASDFGFLNQTSTIESLKHPEKRYKKLSMREYYEKMQMDNLDLDFATESEKKEIEERKAGRVWRALRASVGEGRRMGVCERLYTKDEESKDGGTAGGSGSAEGWNLKALIGEEADEAKKEDGVQENAAAIENNENESDNVKVEVNTPLPIDEAVSTPTPALGTDGTIEGEQQQTIATPQPEHVAALPIGTAEEGTPSPNPEVAATIEGQGTEAEVLQEVEEVHDEEGARVPADTETALEAVEAIIEAEAEAQPSTEDVAKQDDDEAMDAFAPGGIDD